MKKIFILALASLFAFASCSKESNETPENNSDKTVVLSFTSKRPQLKSESKTAWNGSTIVWSEGDKIRMGYTFNDVWKNKDGGDEARFYASKPVSIEDENNSNIGTFTSDTELSNQGEGTYVFYSYYPSTANNNTLQPDAPVVTFNLPSAQNPQTSSFDPSTDIMIGKSASMALSALPENPVEISWYRLVAHADLTFKNLAFVGTEAISSITLTANDNAKLTGTFTADLTDGSLTPATSNKVVLAGANLTVSGSNVEAWCCILPVTITSLKVEVVTDKAKYTREISGISKTFKQNARNTLAINMSTATREALSLEYAIYSGNITEGDYVIVSETIAMKNTVSSDRLGYTNVTISDNKIMNPDASIIWHIAPSGDYWTIYNASVESYAASTGAKNKAQLLADGTDDKSLWTVSGESSYEFVNKQNDANNVNKNLRYNSGYGFACYATATGSALTLYKLQAPDTRIDPELSFSPTSKSVAWADKDNYVAPTLNNIYSVSVSYSSSDVNVATVDETNGTITFVGNGTTTITAAFDGNTTYKPGSATYSLNVTGAPEPGTADNPYTATEAKNAALGGSTAEVYVKGIISSIVFSYSEEYPTFTFYISEDGTSDIFEIYKTSASSVDDYRVGDYVVFKGTLTTYYSTAELAEGSTLISQVKAPVFSPDGGNFVTSQSITITAETGAEIRYTTDGTTVPTATTGSVYSGTITISATTTIKAITIKDGITSGVVTRTFEKVSSSSVTVSFTGSSSGGMTTDRGEQTGVKNNVTIVVSDGLISGEQIRIYKNATITISVPSGKKIKKIEFTCTASGTSQYGPGCFASLTGYTYSGTTGTWSGDSNSVTLTASSNQVRATEIKVTYE